MSEHNQMKYIAFFRQIPGSTPGEDLVINQTTSYASDLESKNTFVAP